MINKVEKIIELREKGLTIRDIQKELCISSPSVVYHYLKTQPYKTRNFVELREEIESLKKENKYLKNQIEKIKKIIGLKNEN